MEQSILFSLRNGANAEVAPDLKGGEKHKVAYKNNVEFSKGAFPFRNRKRSKSHTEEDGNSFNTIESRISLFKDLKTHQKVRLLS